MSDHKLVVCHITEESLDLFHSMVNLSGVRQIYDFAGEIFELGLTEYIDKRERNKDTLSNETKLFLMHVTAKRRIRMQQSLNEIAITANTDEKMQELYDLAVDLNLDPEEAGQFAENSAMCKAVKDSDEHTTVGDCARWLAGLLARHGGQLPYPEIKDLAAGLKYSDSTLHRAKKIIGVIHEPMNRVWYWRIPSDEDQQPTQVPVTAKRAK